jgi:hypothetical protein
MRRSSLAEHWIGNQPDPAATFDIFDPRPGALERMKSCLCQTGGPVKSDFANLGGSNRPPFAKTAENSEAGGGALRL